MRSFAVVAGFAAAANAYAYGYPAANTTSSVAAYETPSAPGYPVSSAAPYTTTHVVTGLTTVCPEPTTVTYGSKTYTVSTSTTIVDDDCEYTTTYEVKPTPPAVKPTPSAEKPAPSAEKPYSPVAPPAATTYAPPAYSQAPPPQAPYPSAGNATTPYPTGAQPSASPTKPATPEFTGAAAQAGVGLLAVIGAVAAFL